MVGRWWKLKEGGCGRDVLDVRSSGSDVGSKDCG